MVKAGWRTYVLAVLAGGAGMAAWHLAMRDGVAVPNQPLTAMQQLSRENRQLLEGRLAAFRRDAEQAQGLPDGSRKARELQQDRLARLDREVERLRTLSQSWAGEADLDGALAKARAVKDADQVVAILLEWLQRDPDGVFREIELIHGNGFTLELDSRFFAAVPMEVFLKEYQKGNLLPSRYLHALAEMHVGLLARRGNLADLQMVVMSLEQEERYEAVGAFLQEWMPEDPLEAVRQIDTGLNAEVRHLMLRRLAMPVPPPPCVTDAFKHALLAIDWRGETEYRERFLKGPYTPGPARLPRVVADLSEVTTRQEAWDLLREWHLQKQTQELEKDYAALLSWKRITPDQVREELVAKIPGSARFPAEMNALTGSLLFRADPVGIAKWGGSQRVRPEILMEAAHESLQGSESGQQVARLLAGAARIKGWPGKWQRADFIRPVSWGEPGERDFPNITILRYWAVISPSEAGQALDALPENWNASTTTRR